jgi:hypothetical protein
VEEVAAEVQEAQQQEGAIEDWAPAKVAAEEQQQTQEQEQEKNGDVIEPAAAAATLELEPEVLPNGGPAQAEAAAAALGLAAAAGIITPSTGSGAPSTPSSAGEAGGSRSSAGQPVSEEEDALMLRGLLEEELSGQSHGASQQGKQPALASPDPQLRGLPASLDSPAKANGTAGQQQQPNGVAGSAEAGGSGNRAMRECAVHLW